MLSQVYHAIVLDLHVSVRLVLNSLRAFLAYGFKANPALWLMEAWLYLFWRVQGRQHA